MQTHADVEAVFAAGLHHVLVGTDTSGLQSCEENKHTVATGVAPFLSPRQQLTCQEHMSTSGPMLRLRNTKAWTLEIRRGFPHLCSTNTPELQLTQLLRLTLVQKAPELRKSSGAAASNPASKAQRCRKHGRLCITQLPKYNQLWLLS